MVAIVASTNSSATVISNNETVTTMVKSGGGNDLFLYSHYDRATSTAPQNSVSAATIGGNNLTEDDYVFFDNVGTQDLYIGNYYVTDANIPTSANPTLSKTNSIGVTTAGAYFHLSGVDQAAPMRAAHANAYQTIVDSASSRQYTGETGDLVYYIVSLNTPNGGMNVPAGFTELMSTTAGDHGDTLLDIFAVYYKVLTADETDASIALPMNATGTFRGWHWARVVKAAAGGTISVSTDFTIQMNALQSLFKDQVFALEYLNSVTANFDILTDYLQLVSTDNSFLLDLLGAIQTDHTIALDMLASVQTDHTGLVDFLSNVIKDYAIALDALQIVQTDYIAQLEILQRIPAVKDLIVEFLENRQKDHIFSSDFLATGSVVTDFDIIIDLLQSVSTDYLVNTNLLQGVSTDYASVIQLLQGVSRNQEFLLDSLQEVSSDHTLIIDALQGNSVTTNYTAVIELRERIEQTFSGQLDFLQEVSGSHTIVSDLLNQVTQDFIGLLEARESIGTDFTISLDVIGRVGKNFDIVFSLGDSTKIPAHYVLNVSQEALSFKQGETTIIKFNDDGTVIDFGKLN